MEAPEGLKYTAEHEWVRLEGGRARVGLTDFAQEALGEVVFAALPSLGAHLGVGEVLGEVESTKAVSEVYAPLEGTVVERNEALLEEPDRLNRDPYGEGWFCVLELEADGTAALDGLLDPEAYRALTAD